MKLIQQFFFSKILPEFKFEVYFSVQLYTSFTHEDPTNLQISYHYVYYLEYTELKVFLGHWVCAHKPA